MLCVCVCMCVWLSSFWIVAFEDTSCAPPASTDSMVLLSYMFNLSVRRFTFTSLSQRKYLILCYYSSWKFWVEIISGWVCGKVLHEDGSEIVSCLWIYPALLCKHNVWLNWRPISWNIPRETSIKSFAFNWGFKLFVYDWVLSGTIWKF